MLSTLFFDEADSNAVFRIRQQPPSGSLNSFETLSSLHGNSSDRLQYHYPNFSCHGSVVVPELHASVLWWLDQSAPRVHLLAVNSETVEREKRNCQSRMMTVEVPLSAEARLLACGVSKLSTGGHCMAVTWMTSSMVAGFVRVTLQRDTDASGAVLLSPEGGMVQCAPMNFDRHPSRGSSSSRKGNSTTAQPPDSRALVLSPKSRQQSTEPIMWVSSACVLAEIPPSDRNVAALIVFTDGKSVWRVQLGLDGRATARTLHDDGRKEQAGALCEDILRNAKHTNAEANNLQYTSTLPLESATTSSSWIGKLWSKSGATAGPPARRYITVSSVQHSPYVALLYWNGLVGFYDSELEVVDYVPTCRLPSDQVDLTASVVQQWSTLHLPSNSIHVVTCIGELEARRVVWSRVTQIQRSSDEKVTLQCSYSVAPPTSMAAPMGCAVNDGEGLLMVWDSGIEEDGHLLSARSIGSLFQPVGELSAIVQLFKASVGPSEEWQWRGTETYLCHGGRLHAALAHDTHFILVQRLHDTHRVHVLQQSKQLWQRLIEALRVDILDDNEDGEGPSAAVCTTLHLIPTTEHEETLQADTATSAFVGLWEGYDVLQSTTHGARLLSSVLRDTLSVGTTSQLPSLQRLLSEAQLAGFTPSEMLTEEDIHEAIKLAMAVQPRIVSLKFCTYCRHYLMDSVRGELLGRLAFLALTYVGWAATCALSHMNEATKAMMECIQFVAAAYHAVQVLGPEVFALADALDDHMLESTLRRLLYPAGVPGAPSAAQFAAQVSTSLLRCPNARGQKACVAWASQLQRAHPVLHHYTLMFDIDAGRTGGATSQMADCLAVAEALAQCSVTEATALLVGLGYVVSDTYAPTMFSTIDPAEIHRWINEETGLVPKFYMVGVLRRLVPANPSAGMCASANTIRSVYLIALLQVLQCVLARNCLAASPPDNEEVTELSQVSVAAPYPTLQAALEELQLECYLNLALASLADENFGSCYHDLEASLQLADRLGKTSFYNEHVLHIVSRIVECACASQRAMDTLLRTAHSSARLSDLLVTKWYNTIARMPTKSASRATEALRYRSIMGLHRYLMTRHAFAQCGRVMSDLASLLRCSPLRRSAEASISVGELAALALEAVELIAPHPPVSSSLQVETSPVAGGGPTQLPGSPLSSGFSWLPFEGPAATRLLSRDDIPWLRRRVFQAHCERRLWNRGSTIDCTDLWVDSAPVAEFELAVRKLTNSLMEAKLWTDAYHFSVLSESDGAAVLKEWALHLLRSSDYRIDEEAQAEWEELQEYCADESCLSNQFAGYRTVLLEALVADYLGTYPPLREAHAAADPYTATAVLLQVFEVSRRRQEEGIVPNPGDAVDEKEDISAAAQAARPASLNAQVWLPWVHASVMAIAMLKTVPTDPIPLKAFTAGVIDPLARYARELLTHPEWVAELKGQDACTVANELLAAVDATREL